MFHPSDKMNHPTASYDFSRPAEPKKGPVWDAYAPFFRNPKDMSFEDRECFVLLEEALNGDDIARHTLCMQLLGLELEDNGLPEGK